MDQSEIITLAERLIPVYQTDEFERVLHQVMSDRPASGKLLIKMELNRLMQPCKKSIDLRGRVQGECWEYQLDGITHWLDDVAFNAYHKKVEKFGGYTEGVWDALVNTRNNFRVMHHNTHSTNPKVRKSSPYEAETVHLGFNLRRQEKRLRVQSQVSITLDKGQVLHGVSVDLSPSGAKFKVPSAFVYRSGQIIQVRFVELAAQSTLPKLDKPIEYRVLAIEECYDNDAVKFIRTLRLTETDRIARAIDEVLNSNLKRLRHDNQDKITLARNRGFEHVFMKHTSSLPLFFHGARAELALLTQNNQEIWHYWHDERNQQMFGTLFTPARMKAMIRAGVKGASCTLYAFKHHHQNKDWFYSMLMPEATREQRQLFWHLGAKRDSWRAFRVSIYPLTAKERQHVAQFADELGGATESLTHYGTIEEIASALEGEQYLLTEKPQLPSSTLNGFRHPRKIIGNPKGLSFDALSRRKEPRYDFTTPLIIKKADGQEVHGKTVDLSKRGLSVALDTPSAFTQAESVQVNFLELQLYDKSLPLDALPYTAVRLSPDGTRLQLMITENSKTMKSIAFFNAIIHNNQDKLVIRQEVLPSAPLLQALRGIILRRMVSTPVFIGRESGGFSTRAIGVNHPLESYLHVLAKWGQKERISLEPIYKGRTNTLLATPTKRIDGAKPTQHEIYLSVTLLGNKVIDLDAQLTSEFISLQGRIAFIKQAKAQGNFFALRLTTAPIFDIQSVLLHQDLVDLSQISIQCAAAIEKELTSLIGYVEIHDITEEVLVRLELT
ncbi:PilZ domain-containing protein [Vibrio sp. SM6]|uniref:PilZ domain-containing protein n=1 Tax=Vibrio agarilyticus TaxID=2726741 RepID=A0A7X8YGM5_9VIBR|nr:PilZ domain-containing protein [Vibrio agarilyticus]NLS12700.1 PilZ domain-containing protein [Vibrio agarilyticus]